MFTWCNGCLGEQRTLIRLDRVVVNTRWMEAFPDARVHHVSMSASNHYLLALTTRKPRVEKQRKRRFLFEAMWTRDNICKEVIEDAQDPLRADLDFQIQDRIKSCQTQLQRWNRNGFGNINKVLKQKKDHLQFLKSLNLLHDTAEEIQTLKKEINEILIREEMMWNQRSRTLWIKCGDRNIKFFHATASQRRRKNKIDGLQDEDRV